MGPPRTQHEMGVLSLDGSKATMCMGAEELRFWPERRGHSLTCSCPRNFMGSCHTYVTWIPFVWMIKGPSIATTLYPKRPDFTSQAHSGCHNMAVMTRDVDVECTPVHTGQPQQRLACSAENTDGEALKPPSPPPPVSSVSALWFSVSWSVKCSL